MGLRFWKKGASAKSALPPVTGEATDAIVFTAPREVELTRVNLPEMRAHDVRVDVSVSGISVGTERWALLGLRPDFVFPIVPGYLSVGRVRALGGSVTGYSADQRVLFMNGRAPVGFPPSWMGAHSRTCMVSTDPAEVSCELDLPYCLAVPDAVSDEAAAFAGLAAVSLHGLKSVTITAGMNVAVFGLGMIGQMSAQLASNAGARVTAVDVVPARYIAAEKAGAIAGLNPRQPDFDARMREIAPDGFPLIIDTTGIADAVNHESNYLSMGGTLLFQGWYTQKVLLDLHAFHNKSMHAVFPCAMRAEEVKECLELMASGKLQVEPLITHRWRPQEAPAAYKAVLDNNPSAIGQVFVWS